MEREISSGALLGVVLLALAAVIGLGFGVFSIAKGIANEGTVGVQDSLNAVSQQAFMDYDQKVVTGTQLLAGFNNFEGQPVSILIATRAYREGGTIHPERDGDLIEIEIEGTSDKFINYNAVLKEKDGARTIESTNGHYKTTSIHESDNGAIVFDNNTLAINQAGNVEFINAGSKFQANILKDDSGNYVGVVFEEL